MAHQFTEVLTDDFDGSDDGVQTHTFCLDGVTYEIDLSAANNERLAAALAPFIAAGRRLPARRSPHRKQRRAQAHTAGPDSQHSRDSDSRPRAKTTARTSSVVPVVFTAPFQR